MTHKPATEDELDQALREKIAALDDFGCLQMALMIELVQHSDGRHARAVAALRLGESRCYIPEPDHASWERLKNCVPDDEYFCWVDLAFFVITAGDKTTFEHIGQLVECRLAN